MKNIIVLEARVSGPTEFVLGTSFQIPIEIEQIKLPRDMQEHEGVKKTYESILKRTRRLEFYNMGTTSALPLFPGDKIRAFILDEGLNNPLEERAVNAIHLLDGAGRVKAKYTKPGYQGV